MLNYKADASLYFRAVKKTTKYKEKLKYKNFSAVNTHNGEGI